MFLRKVVQVFLLSILTVMTLSISGWLIFCYWVLPRIDAWRPLVAEIVEKEFQLPLQFDKLNCHFDGMKPMCQLSHIYLSDDNDLGVKDLSIDSITIGVKWWQFWKPTQDVISDAIIKGLSFTWENPQHAPLSFLHIQNGQLQYRHVSHSFVIEVNDLALRSSLLLKPELDLHSLNAYGTWNNGVLNIGHAAIKDEKVDIQFKGIWREDSLAPAGIVNISGKLNYVSLPQLYTLLPSTLNHHASSWLQHAFKTGSVENANFVLTGDLDYFPFGRYQDKGYFEVKGIYNDLLLDFHQVSTGHKAWYPISSKQGYIYFIRDEIQTGMDRGSLYDPELPIDLTRVKATITGLESGTRIHISSQAESDVKNWLKFINQTPIANYSHDFLKEASGQGKWRGQINLNIPAVEVDNTQVSGWLNLNQSTLQIGPDWPVLSDLEGNLHFTQEDLNFQQVKGSFYGSPVTIDGQLISDELKINSQLSAQSLLTYTQFPAMKRLQGSTKMNARFKLLPKGFKLSVNSDLQGLSYRFPSSLTKTAKDAYPLNLTWSPFSEHSSLLELNLGERYWLALEHDFNDDKKPYFYRGILVANQKEKPSLQHDGWVISGSLPQVNVQEWLALLDEFQSSNPSKKSRAVLPSLYRIDLKTDDLVYLNNHFGPQIASMQRLEKAWQFNLSGKDNSGQFVLTDEGELIGGMEKLTIRYQADASNAQKTSRLTLKDLPAIEFNIQHLFYQEKDWGKVSILAQRLEDEWHLFDGTLTAADAQLNLNAQVAQENQALKLKMNYDFHFDKLSDYESLFHEDKKQLEGGKGSLTGQLEMPDLNHLDFATVNTQFELKVSQGRFVEVDNSALKFLSLLSIQSLGNIKDIGSSISAVSGGMPFSFLNLKGRIHQDKMMVDDLNVDSQTLKIFVKGITDLSSKALDFRVVVVPKFDLSGAAVLTGVLVNPLVGAGAFLSQWLLQEPLAKSLTKYYEVKGNWQTPDIQESKNFDASSF
ncbi:YhdP family phospholipid transporter [Basilea psittacipulmonis]|uniref:YhdP central domain-containing protein n=1 Tax=Basilea psittacipulmonis DSM 24701 TaxID=1072685 RepID=A0A077DC94_9BURK|nr:DUF3971 domain-containing protein [Basilea psittacipulmonis]AIL32515.1 hypothetical protein IX83_03625 [Basilea psittacipulmonis DSM 24701]